MFTCSTIFGAQTRLNIIMKIVILGGGYTGLTAAYDLAVKGHAVTVLEKAPRLGGLAVGFKGKGWMWELERAYHHLFATDSDIINFAEEIGFNDIYFKAPLTASLYEYRNNYRIFPVDTPQDFLKLPMLSWPDKIRSAAILGFLKFSPYLSIYERETAQEFLINTMGHRGWEVLWSELFKKKFGTHASEILAAFIWARITKRTKNLGYIKGGFQTFTDFLQTKLQEKGVEIYTGVGAQTITQTGKKFITETDNDTIQSDVVVSTLPTQVLSFVAKQLLPQDYLNRFNSLHYLHAVVVVVESMTPVLDKTYWLNICTPKLPLMFVGQHTNFVDKKNYSDHHIAYVGWYVDEKHPLISMGKEDLFSYISPHLKTIQPDFSQKSIIETYLFKAPYAQPIFDKSFVKNKPSYETPINNFYIANLDMTYPYDRGTNYAVKLGRNVARLI